MAKAVRMADIAEKLNVSVVTVSKALSGKDGVGSELRETIIKTADEMGYLINKKPILTIRILSLSAYSTLTVIWKRVLLFIGVYMKSFLKVFLLQVI